MIKKTLITAMLVVAAMLATAQTKPLKFGHINSQELISKMPEMDAALTKLEDLQTLNNEKLKLMQQELQNQSNAYVKIRTTLDALAKQSREKELEQMSQNIQSFYQTGQEDMKVKQQELTEPVIEKARKAVEDIGKENGFLYIFDISKGEVLYMGTQSTDILPLALKKLGIATPAVQ